MNAEPGNAREAAERTAEAVMTGDLARLMADITPEALTQMMQLAPAGGGISLSAMPNITGYEVTPAESPDGAEVFHVSFRSEAGTATIATTWKQVMGQWKITAIGLVAAQAAASES